MSFPAFPHSPITGTQVLFRVAAARPPPAASWVVNRTNMEIKAMFNCRWVWWCFCTAVSYFSHPFWGRRGSESGNASFCKHSPRETGDRKPPALSTTPLYLIFCCGCFKTVSAKLTGKEASHSGEE